MATSFIDTVKNTLNSFFAKKDSTPVVVGVDIGASSIKLVEMTVRNGKVVLNNYGSIAIGPYANSPVGSTPNAKPEEIAKALTELFTETTASKNKVGVTLPTSSSLFRDISIPDTITGDEVKTVITTEARKVIPVPGSEVDIDWLPIPNDIVPDNELTKNKNHYLLIALSHESQKHVESYMNLANIKPVMYELEVFSSMRSIYEHERAPIVLIDLGAAHIKVSIIHEGVIRRAVSLDRGFNYLDNSIMSENLSFESARKIKHESSIAGQDEYETKLRDAYVSLMKDVQSVINEYEKYSSTAVIRAVILGGGAEMRNIVSYTESVLGIPTEKSKPFTRAEVPDLVVGIIDNIEPEFTIAAGIALRLLNS